MNGFHTNFFAKLYSRCDFTIMPMLTVSAIVHIMLEIVNYLPLMCDVSSYRIDSLKIVHVTLCSETASNQITYPPSLGLVRLG